MNKTIMMTILAAILGLGMYVHQVHAAPPIQVNCNMDPNALSNILSSGVSNGDKLLISGTCTGRHTITNSITLDGKGNAATLDAQDVTSITNPVLTIAMANTVVIKDLTITGGKADGPHSPGIPSVAGINNNGTLTLINSSVIGNSDQGGPESTGGIRNNGMLTLINSSVSDNAVRSGSLPTGGILNLSGKTATLIDSTVSSNWAETFGGPGTGGIHNQGLLILSNSAISENNSFSGSRNTGGIRNSGGGTVMLMDSTVSKNTATGGGTFVIPVGGILNQEGTVSLSNTTVSKNEVNACVTCPTAAGGIYNLSPGIDTLVLTNGSTVSKNMAVGALDNIGGIGILVGVVLVPNIMNSIVKNNIPKDCNFDVPACIVAP